MIKPTLEDYRNWYHLGQAKILSREAIIKSLSEDYTAMKEYIFSTLHMSEKEKDVWLEALIQEWKEKEKADA